MSRQIEQALNTLGFDVGSVDGERDDDNDDNDDTADAVGRCQRSRGLEPRGTLTTHQQRVPRQLRLPYHSHANWQLNKNKGNNNDDTKDGYGTRC